MKRSLNFTAGDLEGLAGRGTLAVLCREMLADVMTPVTAFIKTAAQEEHGFLLESVEGGENLARYSFLGGAPRRVFRIRAGKASLQESEGREETLPGPPLEALRQIWRVHRPVPMRGLPRFTGGLVGFFSYDLVRCLERLPDVAADDQGIPEAVLGEYETLLAFDHIRNRLLLMSVVDLRGDDVARQGAYKVACRHLDRLAALLEAPAVVSQIPAVSGESGESLPAQPASHYLAEVQRAKDQIEAGEIFQVVLSRRFSCPWQGDPLTVYRWLRSLNPSPYHFYLACKGDYLAGASPEMLVRVEGRRVTVRPIAGTRPRGEEDVQDRALEAELRADIKERAEHVMLVDLARNDVGRVSRPGSVEVEQFAAVQRFSHVMHLVSTVTGELGSGQDALHALAACFPAGTLTGAPKVRAMEIIEAAEPCRRGPYGGAVGYLGYSGDLDSCITIRTVVLTGGQAHVQAGAGIVADSRPLNELQEIDHKAGAMLEALRQAREGVV